MMNKKNAGKMSWKINLLCAVLWAFCTAMNLLGGQCGLSVLNAFLVSVYVYQIVEELRGVKKQSESLA